jgi:hypothetical protein
MGIYARWQRLPKSNLSLRRRREAPVTNRLLDYATFGYKRTGPVQKGAYLTKIISYTQGTIMYKGCLNGRATHGYHRYRREMNNFHADVSADFELV